MHHTTQWVLATGYLRLGSTIPMVSLAN